MFQPVTRNIYNKNLEIFIGSKLFSTVSFAFKKKNCSYTTLLHSNRGKGSSLGLKEYLMNDTLFAITTSCQCWRPPGCLGQVHLCVCCVLVHEPSWLWNQVEFECLQKMLWVLLISELIEFINHLQKILCVSTLGLGFLPA